MSQNNPARANWCLLLLS